MRKTDLAKRLSEASGVSKAQAADQLDRVVQQIVTNLRKGQPVKLPGLGRFKPGQIWQFEFDEDATKSKFKNE